MNKPTIIITGASQGLGAAIASIAAERGAQVVLAARSAAALERQAQQIEQRGGSALSVVSDISRFEDCQRIVDRTLQVFGKIDALINNAATIEPLATISQIHDEEWRQHFAVNLHGPAMLCQLAIPHLRQTQGRVINVTSHGAEIAIAGASAYSASKAALNRFSKVLAVEEPAIAVILFIPGEVDTHMQEVLRTKGQANEEVHRFFMELYEQGKLLSPETPALAAVHLALGAPLEWSGEILEWNDERVQELVKTASIA
jgi:NAD(P)-dependent dehydrogenase (short-subunit alcohol dehydrogenase family)